MLYRLLHHFPDWLQQSFHRWGWETEGLNVVRYISFRTFMALFTALGIYLLVGKRMVRWLSRRQFWQAVRDDGPISHLKKEGTPTMGGLLLWLAVGIALLLWADWSSWYVILLVIVTFGFGLIGFFDDYRKVILRDHHGLRARFKFPLQLAVAGIGMLMLFDAFGFDRIVIETVGVGQVDVDITGIAQTVLVVLVPEAGDDIQMLKAGLTEIGDIFVVNKADRPGADEMKARLLAMPDNPPPVFLTKGQQGEGMAELLSALETDLTRAKKDKARLERLARFREKRFMELCLEVLQQQWKAHWAKDPQSKKLIQLVRDGKINPYEAVKKTVAGGGVEPPT